MKFSDYLQTTIEKNNSYLCAGFDLRFETIPKCFHAPSELEHSTREHNARIRKTVEDYYLTSLEAVHPYVACIKPNMAFFERCGFGALEALSVITKKAKALNVPVILDAKRGDIGSTNAAYAEAYFKPPTLFGTPINSIYCDAMTVNLSLGLESVAPLVSLAVENNKGVFFLVRTSNPDSPLFQNALTDNNIKVCEEVARWIAETGQTLLGECGLSGLGAVLGATHPDEAQNLRTLMPKNFFLIPGFGAQGGSTKEARAGFADRTPKSIKGAAVINSSRGLFADANKQETIEDFAKTLAASAKETAEILFN